MSPDDERHGTTRQTLRDRVAGCTCWHCERSRTNARRKNKLRKMGQPQMVPNGDVRNHVAALTGAGWNHQQIAKAAGVGPSTLSELRNNKRQTINRETAAAILSVTGDALGPWVPALGTVRRLQALAALGWPMRTVCIKAGLNGGSGKQLLHRNPNGVTADLAARIAAVYDELCMKPAPQGRTFNHVRTIAKTRRYAPPLAWLNIDDPDEQPASAWKPTRNRKPADLFAELDHLLGLGVSEFHAAKQLGITQDAIEKARARAGRVA